jgi:hypothetical protein
LRWLVPEEFIVGVNLPWLSYGGDFGANRWQPCGGVGQPARRLVLREVLRGLAGHGIAAVRWFMLADGRAGLQEPAAGEVAGLDDCVFRDADAALEELERAGLTAVFVLFDFHWFNRARIVDGVRTGGRGPLAADEALRARLLDRVVGPLLERYGRHSSIAAWDVINEPEWVTRGIRLPPRRSDVPRQAMQGFIRDVVDLIHDRTSQAATVGCASTRTLPLVAGLGLDVYQAHWYDRLERRAPLDRPVGGLGLDRPLILGEFPTRGSARTPVQIMEAARQSGYAAAFAWSVMAGDPASDHRAFVADVARFQAG